MSLVNKVALVTGASSGIGAAIAILFAKEGADVAMVGRNETKLKNVAAQVSKVGKAPLVIKADVSIDDDVRRIVKDTVDKYGRVDILVNNAGFFKAGSILDGNLLKSYDDIMRTNVRAVVYLTGLIAPYLIKTKGNIINISSITAIAVPDPEFMAYYISKAGLDHFTRGIALELGPSGVRVNSVNPGPVVTDFLENGGYGNTYTNDDLAATTVLNRTSSPEEIADLVLFLASDKAKSITGAVHVIDNGELLMH